MRKFILATGLFAAGFIVLNLLLYFLFFYPSLYKDYIVGKKQMEKYRVFLFSDSHGMVLDQTLLDHAGIFNFSYGSDSYRDIYFKLNYILTKDIHPEAVIITADDHTLSKYRKWMNNKNRSICYADFRSYTAYYPTNFINFLYLKYGYRYLPMLNPNNSGLYNKFMISRLKVGFTNNKSEVIQWIDRKDKVKRSKDRKKIQFRNNEVATEMKDALKDIFKLCHDNNIEVYGIKFPLTKVYIKEMDGASYHADSVFMANSLPLLDYKEVFKENDSLFLDHDHLNAKGALNFLELLTTDLKKSRLSGR